MSAVLPLLVLGILVVGALSSATPRDGHPRSSSVYETFGLSPSERLRRADVRQAVALSDALVRDSEVTRGQLRQRVSDAYDEYLRTQHIVESAGLNIFDADPRVDDYGAACRNLRQSQIEFERHETLNLACWDRKTRLCAFA